jgi:hypothetical protein
VSALRIINMKYVILAVVVFSLARVHAGMNAGEACVQEKAPAQPAERIEEKKAEAPRQPPPRTIPLGHRVTIVYVAEPEPPPGTTVDLIADVPGQAKTVVVFPGVLVVHATCIGMGRFGEPPPGNAVALVMSPAEIQLLYSLLEKGATLRIDDYSPKPRRKRG